MDILIASIIGNMIGHVLMTLWFKALEKEEKNE